MSRPVFIAAVLALTTLPLSSVGMHGSNSFAAKAKATQTTPGEDGCYKIISAKGRPHKLNTVASLSAVRQWSQTATKHGDSFAMWHNASGGTVKCEKLPRSDYYSCYASGKPCPSRSIPANTN